MSQISIKSNPEEEEIDWREEYPIYAQYVEDLGEEGLPIYELAKNPHYSLDDLEEVRYNLEELYHKDPITQENIDHKLAEINAQLMLSGMDDLSDENRLNERVNLLDNLPTLNPFTNMHFVLKGTDDAGHVIYRSITKNNANAFSGISYVDGQPSSGSDGFDEIMNYDYYDLEVVMRENSNSRREGDLFKYMFKDSSLNRYMIYDKFDESTMKILKKYNCLMYALELNGEDISGFNVTGPTVRMSSITKIANDLDAQIIVTKIEKGKTRYSYFNPKAPRTINIGLLEGHYFLNEVIDNPCRTKTFNRQQVKSFHLIKHYLDNKMFTPVREYELRDKISDVFIDITSDNIDKEFRIEGNPVVYKERKLKKKDNKTRYSHLVFADIESYTDTKIHVPYLISWTLPIDLNKESNDGDFGGVRSSYHEGCIDVFLTSLKPNTLIIFHNMQYDMSMVTNYLSKPSITKKDNSIYSVEGYYKNKRLTFHDSYKIIPAPLKSFGPMFNLPVEKEVFPYDFYKSTLNKSTSIPKTTKSSTQSSTNSSTNDQTSQTLSFVSKMTNDPELFIQNCKKLGMRKIFDYRKYAIFYCNRDVEVLARGYLKFRKFLLEQHNFDSLMYLTISSYADEYFKSKGCYKDVFQLCGDSREFIQNAVVGGRVMTNSNKKYNIKFNRYKMKGVYGYKNFLSDFDAVSLYPSAMKRLKDEHLGFPKGLPIQFTKTFNNLEEIESVTKNNYYVVKIQITSIGIKRDFPLMSLITEGRDFENNNYVMTVDKISLEDMVKFQKITFETIEGVWFPDGYNDQISSEIQDVFDIRVKLKKDGNPLQFVIKNLMNSSYGKTILKPSSMGFKMFTEKEAFDKYYNDYGALITNYYEYTHRCTYMDGSSQDRVLYSCDYQQDMYNHYNRPHCGTIILSMSKRIMNEVMCLADDLRMKIYIQDTDSMHISFREVNVLAKKFYEKYNRHLVGSKMGQFHTDFDGFKMGETGSVRLYALQKKIYYDKLIPFKVIGYNDYNLPVIDEKFNLFLFHEGTKDHIRMKGVSHSAIQHYSKENSCTVMQIYKKLFDDQTLKFNLIAGTVKFKYLHKFNQIKSLEKFERNISTTKYSIKISDVSL